MAFCLLSVIRKQYLKQCNYSVDQSALLTGFRTDFTSSVWNFCRSVVDVPLRETSPAAKSKEKRTFSQATVSADILIVCQSTYQSSVRVVLDNSQWRDSRYVDWHVKEQSTDMSNNSRLGYQPLHWPIIGQQLLSVICQWSIDKVTTNYRPRDCNSWLPFESLSISTETQQI